MHFSIIRYRYGDGGLIGRLINNQSGVIHYPVFTPYTLIYMIIRLGLDQQCLAVFAEPEMRRKGVTGRLLLVLWGPDLVGGDETLTLRMMLTFKLG